MDEPTRKGPERCSFCGRTPAVHHRVFTGTHASICEQCVTTCADMLAETGSRYVAGHYGQPGYGRVVVTASGRRYEALPVVDVA